ncbi:chemotaxis protein CheD [Massilia sp. G4R7]|uniref:Probable chemoreceptor glutamine deamidase CheD n=1 Tax=Massilia phyllostachyos TaxID=2898585 RepID=A0ABS8Q9L2_9BURK|nr:chemotaxis protein CheD [Massilia phyllostachyos]MCD2518444.1 chemotaxis protein CheD [Massilia phyllostachyos]
MMFATTQAFNHAARTAPPPALPQSRARMDIEHTRHVYSGQMRVGAGEDVLTALLGSCVGIGIIWRARGRCGLAHCFLPDSVDTAGSGARYVSAAIPGLLAAMGVRREHYGEVEVVVAGGAHMLRTHGADHQVGRRNIAAAREHLASRGLNVAFQDVGGSRGRRISIDCERQTFEVVRVGEPQEAFA